MATLPVSVIDLVSSGHWQRSGLFGKVGRNDDDASWNALAADHGCLESSAATERCRSVAQWAASGVRRIDVRTALQMADAVVPLAPGHDVFIATAAVADWRPALAADQKLKKANTAAALALVENPDILASLSAPRPSRPGRATWAARSTTA